MQPSNKNNNVFADCFAALCFRLSGLVARFGGDKLRANFEEGVNTSAAARDAGLALREGRILSRNEDLDWTQYRDILAQVISRAREIAGDKTVKSEIREDGARSAAHVLGFGFSLLLAYYANRAWQQFRGGVYATTASYTLAGAVVFAVAFAVVEIRHDFGVDLLTAVNGMQLKMAVSMVLFTSTVFAFGWAYFRLARALDRA